MLKSAATPCGTVAKKSRLVDAFEASQSQRQSQETPEETPEETHETQETQESQEVDDSDDDWGPKWKGKATKEDVPVMAPRGRPSWLAESGDPEEEEVPVLAPNDRPSYLAAGPSSSVCVVSSEERPPLPEPEVAQKTIKLRGLKRKIEAARRATPGVIAPTPDSHASLSLPPAWREAMVPRPRWVAGSLRPASLESPAPSSPPARGDRAGFRPASEWLGHGQQHNKKK